MKFRLVEEIAIEVEKPTDVVSDEKIAEQIELMYYTLKSREKYKRKKEIPLGDIRARLDEPYNSGVNQKHDSEVGTLLKLYTNLELTRNKGGVTCIKKRTYKKHK